MNAGTTAPSPAETPVTQPPRRRWRGVALVVAVLLAIAVVGALIGVHLTAEHEYQVSFDATKSLAERTDGASLALRLEPWNAAFATRATAMQTWRHGAEYLAQGAYLPAMLELAAAYKLDVGDKELLAQFQRAQKDLSLHSNYKAHVQHAHEGPGGTLRPQDLLP